MANGRAAGVRSGGHAKPRIIRFNVPNMVCSGCTGTIKSILKSSESVAPLRVTASWVTKEVIVTIPGDRSESDAEILSAIKTELASISFTLEPTKTILSYVLKGIIGTLTGLALMIIMACGLAIPMYGMFLIAGLSSVLTLYLGWDSYKSAVTKLFKAKTLTMDALFTVSTLTAVAVSIAALFVPWLPSLFDAALLIFGFRHIGVAIEQAIRRKIVKGVSFCDRVAREVEVESHGKISVATIEVLNPGDVIRIRKGEYIPVDGELIDDESSVYETILNGKGRPTVIRKNYRLRAGMRVADDVDIMRIKVTKRAEDSYLARADKRLNEAQSESSPIEVTADKILKYFVPAVFLIAAVSGIVIGCLFPPALAVQCVIATLVSACPCTLGFIVPLSVYIGIDKGRKYGVEFKGGAPLQAASRIDTVVFDLNGTLTTGVPIVSRMKVLTEKMTKAEALSYMYALEREARKKHPIAKAIHRYAKKNGVMNGASHLTITERDNKHYHSGVRAKINGAWYTLGNRAMMLQVGIDEKSIPVDDQDDAEHAVYLARDNEVVSIVHLTDPLRDDAIQVVRDLQKTKNVYICTGADQKTANKYARRLNIDEKNVFANCAPMDEDADECVANAQSGRKSLTKTGVIEQLKKLGKKVAFVGDAANDALAMTSCFGVAVRSPSADEVTEDNASVVIEGSSLRPVLATFEIAKQTIRNIKQSLVMSLLYNMGALLIAGGLLVAIGFVLNPGIGVALMVVQACLILLCAYHFKQKSLSITAEALAVPEVPIYKDSNTHLKVNAKLLGVKPAIALEQTVGEDAHPKPTFADRIAGGLLRFFARTPNSSGGKSCVLPQTEVRSTQIPPRRMLSV